MLIPEPLEALLTRSLDAVRNHPQHALLPIHRRAIYDYLGPVSDRSGYVRLGRLALASGQRVLPVWLEARPDDGRAARLLDLAQRVIEGTADQQTLDDEALLTHGWLRNDYGERKEKLADKVSFALEAIVAASFTALGVDPFTDVPIKEQDTDADIDPWSSDAASYSATVFAGPVWKARTNKGARLAFWTWWLTEAVPQAWRAG